MVNESTPAGCFYYGERRGYDHIHRIPGNPGNDCDCHCGGLFCYADHWAYTGHQGKGGTYDYEYFWLFQEAKSDATGNGENFGKSKSSIE